MAARDDARGTRRGAACALVAMLALAVSAVLLLPGRAGAAPNPSPTPAPSATGNLQPNNGLPISLNLLGITVNLTLPLDLTGLLGGGQTSSSTTTPPPPPPTSPHSSTHSAPPPSHAHSTTPATRVITTRTVQIIQGAVQPRVVHSAPSSSHTTARPHSSKTHSASGPAELFNSALRNLLPTSITRALYLLTLLAGIGIVVAVIRMGRRGGRHTA